MGVGIGLLPTRFKQRTDNIVHCFELPAETKVTCWLVVSPTAYRRPEVKAFAAYFAPRYSALFHRD